MPGSTSRALTLTARVFCLLMAALLTLFSLDAFSPDRPLAGLSNCHKWAAVPSSTCLATPNVSA